MLGSQPAPPFIYFGPEHPTLYYPKKSGSRLIFVVHKSVLQPNSVIIQAQDEPTLPRPNMFDKVGKSSPDHSVTHHLRSKDGFLGLGQSISGIKRKITNNDLLGLNYKRKPVNLDNIQRGSVVNRCPISSNLNNTSNSISESQQFTQIIKNYPMPIRPVHQSNIYCSKPQSCQTDWKMSPTEDFIFVATSQIITEIPPLHSGQRRLKEFVQYPVEIVSNIKRRETDDFVNMNHVHNEIKISEKSLKGKIDPNKKGRPIYQYPVGNHMDVLSNSLSNNEPDGNVKKTLYYEIVQNIKESFDVNRNKDDITVDDVGRTVRKIEEVGKKTVMQNKSRKLNKLGYLINEPDIMMGVVQTLGLDESDKAVKATDVKVITHNEHFNRKVNSDTESDCDTHEEGEIDFEILPDNGSGASFDSNAYSDLVGSLIPQEFDFGVFNIDQFDLSYMESSNDYFCNSNSCSVEKDEIAGIAHDPDTKLNTSEQVEEDKRFIVSIIIDMLEVVAQRSFVPHDLFSSDEILFKSEIGHSGQMVETIEDIQQFILSSEVEMYRKIKAVKEETPSISEGASTSKHKYVDVATNKITVSSPIVRYWGDGGVSSSSTVATTLQNTEEPVTFTTPDRNILLLPTTNILPIPTLKVECGFLNLFKSQITPIRDQMLGNVDDSLVTPENKFITGL